MNICKNRLTGLVAGTALLLAAAMPASAMPMLYGISGAGVSDSSLYTIDPTTGAATLIGATGFSHITNIDFNPVNGVLYGISNSTDALITIDTATGVGTAITGGVINFNAPDISFDPGGTLYTWSEPGPDQLNTVDLGTGAQTQIGFNTLGNSTFQLGLDIDSSGTIYIKNGDGKVYTIDSLSGAETLVADFATSIFDNALAFDSSDTLFTLDRDGPSTFLYTLDLVGVTSTLIGDTGVGRLAAIAFVNVDADVPEPGTLLLVGLGLIGLFGRKRA